MRPGCPFSVSLRLAVYGLCSNSVVKMHGILSHLNLVLEGRAGGNPCFLIRQLPQKGSFF